MSRVPKWVHRPTRGPFRVPVGALGGFLLALSGCFQGETAVDSSAVEIIGSERHEIRSDNVGDRFLVSIALPLSYADAEASQAYPVVYALDANAWAWFGTYTEIARMGAVVDGLPEVILVGVGYPYPAAEALGRRSRDMTPVPSERQNAFMRERAPDLPASFGTGGAAAFRRFLADELIPYVESRYRADSNQRVLFGHSFGGLFALDVLFSEPDMFTDYIVGSPSIWYGDEITLQSEARFAGSGDELRADVFLSVGSLEERSDDERSLELAMVSNVLGLSEKLRSRGYPELDLETVVFEGETHNGVIPATFGRGLKWIFR